MNKTSLLTAVMAILLAGAAWALDLDAAKSQGLVGEQPDGYLGVVQASPEVLELVADVNGKRREAYQRIARQNGITLEQVGVLAGEKTIEKTPAGGYVKDASGRWVKK